MVVVDLADQTRRPVRIPTRGRKPRQSDVSCHPPAKTRTVVFMQGVHFDRSWWVQTSLRLHRYEFFSKILKLALFESTLKGGPNEGHHTLHCPQRLESSDTGSIGSHNPVGIRLPRNGVRKHLDAHFFSGYSRRQLALQPSPLLRFPSSHSSLPSRSPLPQSEIRIASTI